MNQEMKQSIDIVLKTGYQLKNLAKTNQNDENSDEDYRHFIDVEPSRSIMYNCNVTCEPESIKQSKTRNRAISASIKICFVK